MLLYVNARAQNYYFKGEVRDEQGNILQNAAVLQASTGYLFHTGVEGTFMLRTHVPKDSLLISLDGFEKRTFLADDKSYLKATLRKAVYKPLYRLSSQTKDLPFGQQQQWFNGDETYATTVENGFVAAEKFPATGITLNVDRASYSNVRRFLNSKTPVPPDAVRIEELLNYFNFDYQEPPPGKTFAITPTLAACPWNEGSQLLFAHIRSRKLPLDHLPPTHLVFLIDVSASMDAPNRLPLLKAGFKGLVQNLRAQDTVSVVVYGGSVELYLQPTGGDRKAEIVRAIDGITCGGSTPGASGIRLAYEVARRHFLPKGNNRVILATDGDFNVGLRSESELEDMIAEESKSGVYLTCLGVGMGNYKDSKIQVLARKGNGNFAYIDNFSEAHKVLVKEFSGTLYAVADEAVLQVAFDPAYVKNYRLVGFDNVMGAMKDRAAQLEGGEVGSGFSLLVAFEIEPVASAATAAAPARFTLSYKEPGKSEPCEEAAAPVLHPRSFAQLDKPYQFASAVVLFGALLKNSKHIKEKGWNDLLPLATAAVNPAEAEQKEFVQLVEKAKAFYGTRKKKKGIF
ncbi:hypothetical protein GCM10023184_32670 [Flaviaesturariibacter amylovorans]|uniref:VWFA domain-containing protein n=1 Tax=Flaviaesturariibacter amylovorans TaxID=1084520 RepID=A0ABP8HBU6_9BACT